MEVTPEMRRAVAAEDCKFVGHDFGHIVNVTTGEPLSLFCPRCARRWSVGEGRPWDVMTDG